MKLSVGVGFAVLLNLLNTSSALSKEHERVPLTPQESALAERMQFPEGTDPFSQDYRERLGFPEDGVITSNDLDAAYERIARLLHPDHHQSESTEMLELYDAALRYVGQAYEELTMTSKHSPAFPSRVMVHCSAYVIPDERPLKPMPRSRINVRIRQG